MRGLIKSIFFSGFLYVFVDGFDISGCGPQTPQRSSHNLTNPTQMVGENRKKMGHQKNQTEWVNSSRKCPQPGIKKYQQGPFLLSSFTILYFRELDVKISMRSTSVTGIPRPASRAQPDQYQRPTRSQKTTHQSKQHGRKTHPLTYYSTFQRKFNLIHTLDKYNTNYPPTKSPHIIQNKPVRPTRRSPINPLPPNTHSINIHPPLHGLQLHLDQLIHLRQRLPIRHLYYISGSDGLNR